MSGEQLPIKTLVSSQCKDLGLRPAELIRGCGYQNTSKGLRRLEDICPKENLDHGELLDTAWQPF
jgi:hypothetical protein